VAGLWLAGWIALPLYFTITYLRFASRIAGARAATGRFADEMTEVLSQVNSHGRISLNLTDGIGPVLFWRPSGYTVLVPEQSWCELDPAQRRAILRHEVAHWQRSDLWKSLGVRLLASVHWFNPFAWLSVRRFEQAAELQCDTAAGTSSNERLTLAAALLQLGSCETSPAIGVYANTSSLSTRIKRLLHTPQEDSAMKRIVIVSVSALILTLGALRPQLVAQQSGSESQKATDETQTELKDGLDRYGDELPMGAIVRLGTNRLRHHDAVTALDFSLDEKILASSSRSGNIRLWNTANGELVRQFSVERFGVTAIAFSPDCTRIVSGNSRGFVRRWNAETGAMLFEQKPFKGSIDSVVFSPKREEFAVSSGNKSSICDSATGKRIRHVEIPTPNIYRNQIVWSPDGTLIASAYGLNSICIWNLAVGDDLKVIDRPHGFYVESLAFTADSSGLLTGGFRNASDVTETGKRFVRPISELRMWDPKSGEMSREFEADTSDLGGYGIAVPAIGKIIACASHDNIRMFNVETGKTVRNFPRARGSHQPLAISRNARFVASASGGSVVLWDAATGVRLHHRPHSHSSSVASVAYAPDGKLVATASGDGSMRVWDAKTGEQVGSYALSEYGGINAVAFSSDGNSMAFGGYRDDAKAIETVGVLKIWNVGTRRIAKQVA
jgi:WD40 repeat protein